MASHDQATTGARPTARRRAGATLVLGSLVALAAGTLTAAPASAAEIRPATAGSFTMTGHGFGHGIGMSQWGAQSRASAGQSYRTILDFYYPTTAVGTRENRTLRVGLTGFSTGAATIAAPTGAPLTLSTSGRQLAAGQRLVLTPAAGGLAATVGGAGGWTEAWGSTTTVSGPDGVLLVRPDGTSTRYEGTIRVVGGSTLTVVNDVPLETYLRGVVPAESPSSWNAQALAAQAVAARSYALSVLRAAAETDICDTTACQVYRGAEVRNAAGAATWTTPASTNAAIAATAGEVRTYDGAVAFTQFSSSNGGWTVAGSKPYLQAREDPFSAPAGKAAGDTVADWSTTVPASAFAPVCTSGGSVLGLTVLRRDGRGDLGGRVTDALVNCTTGTVPVSGTKLRQLGGLRSDWVAVTSAVALKSAALGGSRSLGAATSGELNTPDGRGVYQHFSGGSVYASPATGAHDVRGGIRDRWAALGWENGLGFPTSDDSRTPDGRGWYTHFQGGSVYSSPATGTHDVRGAIRSQWAALGWENGLGFPTTNDSRTPDGQGWYNHFQGGSIYYTAATGAHEVRGAIAAQWAALGWERGLGYPVTGDQRTPNGAGYYTHFQNGSIYWSPTTGAHGVRGAIRDAWAARGWETGSLGFPTSDESASGGTVTQRFAGGTLVYTAATGRVAVV